mmetsp:Transcript_24512/g.62066  ORF Transcript_24512/g.62066 Transcript_24512/m.62066 type:complete len:317 (-) Transcript_24512:609-1559(-)
MSRPLHSGVCQIFCIRFCIPRHLFSCVFTSFLHLPHPSLTAVARYTARCSRPEMPRRSDGQAHLVQCRLSGYPGHAVVNITAVYQYAQISNLNERLVQRQHRWGVLVVCEVGRARHPLLPLFTHPSFHTQRELYIISVEIGRRWPHYVVQTRYECLAAHMRVRVRGRGERRGGGKEGGRHTAIRRILHLHLHLPAPFSSSTSLSPPVGQHGGSKAPAVSRLAVTLRVDIVRVDRTHTVQNRRESGHTRFGTGLAVCAVACRQHGLHLSGRGEAVAGREGYERGGVGLAISGGVARHHAGEGDGGVTCSVALHYFRY